ncbi:MAG: hypothetical protein ACK5ZR_10305 [Gemmatimonadaceae bacterium]
MAWLGVGAAPPKGTPIGVGAAAAVNWSTLIPACSVTTAGGSRGSVVCTVCRKAMQVNDLHGLSGFQSSPSENPAEKPKNQKKKKKTAENNLKIL